MNQNYWTFCLQNTGNPLRVPDNVKLCGIILAYSGAKTVTHLNQTSIHRNTWFRGRVR